MDNQKGLVLAQFLKIISNKTLEELAKEIDPDKTWQELIVEIKNDYPDPKNMITAHQEWVDKAKAHFLSKHRAWHLEDCEQKEGGEGLGHS